MSDPNERPSADGESAKGRRASDWAPVDLVPYYLGEIEPPKPSIFKMSNGQGLVYPGLINVFIGQSESCKSWAAMLACVELANEGKGSLWVDLEASPATFVERVKSLGVDPDLANRFIRYVQPESGPVEPGPSDTSSQKSAEAWALRQFQWAAAQEAADDVVLVIIDTVTGAMALYGEDGDKREDVDRFYRRIIKLFEGKTLLLIDHLPKAGGKVATGSERKGSFVGGSAIHFEATKQRVGRGRVGTIRLTISKDRHGNLERFTDGDKRLLATMTMDGTGPTLKVHVDASSTLADPDALKRVILAYVKDNPGSSTNDITKANISDGSVSQRKTALQTLVGHEYIGTEPGPRNAIGHHWLRDLD